MSSVICIFSQSHKNCSIFFSHSLFFQSTYFKKKTKNFFHSISLNSIETGYRLFCLFCTSHKALKNSFGWLASLSYSGLLFTITLLWSPYPIFSLVFIFICFSFAIDSMQTLSFVISNWLYFLHSHFCSLLLKRRFTPCCWVFSSLNSFLLNFSLILSHLRLLCFCFILILFFITEVEELSSRKEKKLWSHYTIHLKL